MPRVLINCRAYKAAGLRLQKELPLDPQKIKLLKRRMQTHEKILAKVSKTFVHASDSKKEFLLNHRLPLERMVARLVAQEVRKESGRNPHPFPSLNSVSE